ncbi:aminotransferase class III-fold pyridoxal phosphate-dependent enzyme [Pseudomonas sp. 10C3]|uniref:aminotransferase class III-fold pyridoxal phosphate-dependent enzyme n=1 Tax=Pseudomonas sp. 10C3 TaxID=3118753 RepID=UPI002E803998|nr:aminotransferase class III-fold pyridoxal phosphate-dependent enzyme [Pseudomonas sp. 10C3]MEE3507576.1 aminotransferase class III-fold pyridoxal phosphate-dependent enzyme [Pseudomonas sp. 10C3]
MNFDQIASEVVPRLSKIIGLVEGETLLLEDSLLDMGADSLILIKCVDFINDRYGVSLTAAQLYEEIGSVGEIIDTIARQLPSERIAPPAPVSAAAPSVARVAPAVLTRPAEPLVAGGREVLIHTIVQSQIELMGKHLQLLGAGASVPAAVPVIASLHYPDPRPTARAPLQQPDAAPAVEREDRFNVFNARKQTQKIADPQQQQYLARYMEAYSQKHSSSKAGTDQYRPVLADNRASAGFRAGTKEILFPLLADRTDGAQLWDIDGNRFIDITMGFGVHLLGHGPECVKSKLLEQVQTGIPIGPQSPLAGRVAALISELTGHQRVVFCNSGTEATMTAVRLARAHTGRPKIVLFSESYHGTFDGFLARASSARGDDASGISVGRGIEQSSVDDTLVLEYGDPKSLQIIRERASEIAVVIVEPVQSRHPALQPQEFLAQLREITRDTGVVFLWDEVITGFRIAAGGAQEHFGIRADLAAYGKIVGGGMPIGLVAGDAAILDGIDGGTWQYGDQSAPQTEPIFFAGTFSKHPLAMAAAVQTLEHIKQHASTLYRDLNRLTQNLVDRSNALFVRYDVEMRVEHFGSLFRYVSKRNLDLFFSHLLFNGVFVWEGRNCFLSTAHTDADVDAILLATEEALKPLVQHGFLPSTVTQTAVGRVPTVWEQRFIKLWQTPQRALSVNIGGGIFFPGATDSRALVEALGKATQGAAALLARLDANDQLWWPVQGEISVPVVELTFHGDTMTQAYLDELVASEQQMAFALEGDRQLRATVFAIKSHGLLLCLTANHAACDGAALAVLSEQVMRLHKGERAERLSSQLPLLQTLESDYRASTQFASDQAFWTPRLATLQCQTYRPFERDWQQASGRYEATLSRQAVSTLARQQKVTPFAWVLAGFARALCQSPMAGYGVLAVPFGNRSQHTRTTLCQLTNLLPLLPIEEGTLASEALHVSTQLTSLSAHAAYPALAQLQVPVFASINWEPVELPDNNETAPRLIYGLRRCTEFALEINIYGGADLITFAVDFDRTLIEPADIKTLLDVVQADTATALESLTHPHVERLNLEPVL